MHLAQIAYNDCIKAPWTYSMTDAKRKAKQKRIRGLQAEVERIWRLRQKRAVLKDALKRIHYPIPAKERVSEYLVSLAWDEIVRRDISTPMGLESPTQLLLIDRDTNRRMWLLRYQGWYKYSRRAGTWYQEACYLAGREDDQIWVVRVPSTVSTVDEALDWLTPRAVKEAQAKGRWTARQGDIYLVEMPRLGHDDLAAIDWTRHEWRVTPKGQRRLVHPEHKPIIVPKRVRWVRAIRQRQIDGNGRGHGD